MLKNKILPLMLMSAFVVVPGVALAEVILDTSGAKIDGNRVEGVGVEIDRPGYVVIHDECDGAAPAHLGALRVEPSYTNAAGQAATKYENLSIEATGALDPNCNVSVMLHYETNDNMTFDFGPGSTDFDTPVAVAGQVVSETIDAGM